MIILKEQKSYATVIETPEEQLMSDFELKKHCLKYLDLLRGKVFVNKATNTQIEVNREIKGEIRAKIRAGKDQRIETRVRFLALKIIPYLLIDSDPDILGAKDYKDRPNVVESHIFKYECKINEIRFKVLIRTIQRLSSGQRLYFLNLEDLELSEK